MTNKITRNDRTDILLVEYPNWNLRITMLVLLLLCCRLFFMDKVIWDVMDKDYYISKNFQVSPKKSNGYCGSSESKLQNIGILKPTYSLSQKQNTKVILNFEIQFHKVSNSTWEFSFQAISQYWSFIATSKLLTRRLKHLPLMKLAKLVSWWSMHL